MIETLYIESAIAQHPRSREIVGRFGGARKIPCRHYGEIFNRNAQNFRLQKNKPALILAEKKSKAVLPVPQGYGIGGKHNYYFSHMLNCIYDCRYCFLQGMYRSANYLLFVNFEDFYRQIESTLAAHDEDPVWFFSGYDCDSLALEPVTGFVDHALDFFLQHPQAHLELRTKSTQIRGLLKRQAVANCVVAFSISPQPIIDALEHKTPSLEKRIEALKTLQQAGWSIGLRFDPIIYADNYQSLYRDAFAQIFSALNLQKLHSISVGTFRLPKPFYRRIVNLYPREKLLSAKFALRSDLARYPKNLEREMLEFCRFALQRYVPSEILFFSCDHDQDGA